MPEFDSSYRVLRRRGEPDVRSLEAYRRNSGYTALEKAIREQTLNRSFSRSLMRNCVDVAVPGD
jgi:NADH:ubiquinone oxidoreductase subunit F (NADH-binding)